MPHTWGFKDICRPDTEVVLIALMNILSIDADIEPCNKPGEDLTNINGLVRNIVIFVISSILT